MGGQGKTQTALRYCRKAFQNGTFNTVLWIDASSEISAHQAIKSILYKAEIPTSVQEFEQNLLAFKNALVSLRGPCLLVFDNYDTPKNFSKIADMFVQHEQICILLTSRHHESLRLGMPVHVRNMDQSDAEDLLLTSSGLIRQDVDPKHLANTVNMLGCLPLALDQAGAYIRKLHLSLDLFEKHYIDKQKKILQHTPDLFEYRKSLLPGSEPSVLSVFTTWELSLEQLGDDRPHLEHLLTLAAFFDHNKVHEALFSTRCTLNFTACSGVQDGWLQCLLMDTAWDSYRFQDIVANLHGLSLLQEFWMEDGHIVFSLHPLVNDWLRTRLGEKDRASMIVEAAVTVTDMGGNPSLFSHLVKCVADLSGCGPTLFNDCADIRPPRIIANGTPVAKFVADELNPKPHYRRAEALCCPHGRPCHRIPSTFRLLFLVGCCMAVTMLEIQKHAADFSRDIGMIFKRIVSLSQSIVTNPEGLSIVKATLETCTILFSAITREYDIVNQETETTTQGIETLSGLNVESKEADVKVKQVEEKKSSSKTESSSRAAISRKLPDTSKLSLPLSRREIFVLIRAELRSLPFLQSGL